MQVQVYEFKLKYNFKMMTGENWIKSVQCGTGTVGMQFIVRPSVKLTLVYC